MEERTKLRFPKTYRSLVLRYRYQALEFEHGELFGNVGDGSEQDISYRMYCDPTLSSWLIERGFLHFGRPYLGDYDPICFDTRAGITLDAPVLKFDHEDILLGRDKVHREALAPGFFEFLESVGEFDGPDRWADDWNV